MKPFHRRSDSSKAVDPGEASRLVEAGDAILIDVREPEEWAAGHALSATHMPLAALRPGDLPRDKIIVAVCRSGNRSGKAAEQLRTAGLDVRNLTGGMSAWADAGLPVHRDDGRPGTIA